MNMGLTAFKIRPWRFGNEKHILRLQGNESQVIVHPTCNPVATPTEISQSLNNEKLVEICANYINSFLKAY